MVNILVKTSWIAATILFLCCIPGLSLGASDSTKTTNLFAQYFLPTFDSNGDTLNTFSGLRLPRIPQYSTIPNRTFEVQRPSSVLRTDRLIVTSGALLVLNVAAYQNFKNIWWDYPTTQFHFYRGWRQTQGWYDMGPHDSLWFHMDKLGHYYSTRSLSLILSDVAQWTGFSEQQSMWIGAVASWLFYLEIELFDAQFEQWGFSLGDLAANSAGAFMPIIASKSTFVNRFALKLSYLPSQLDTQHYVIEDYAGMTFWLTTHPDSWFSHRLQWWPSFLNIALGYGITQKVYGDIELFIALDYDLTKIRTGNPFADRLLYYLNYIHFPAPALKFVPAASFHVLYF